jgi:release factor glutamine methyltransferase
MEMNSSASWLTRARRRLEPSTPDAGLEAQLLFAHVLEKTRTWVLAHPETMISKSQQEQLDLLLEKRAGGVPLPYLLGHWEFFGLDFVITPDVLIPRPETELLVEQALIWLKKHPDQRRVADVGTGSGCIAICLAKNQPDLRLIATDQSQAALEIAKKNAGRHDVSALIQWLKTNLLDDYPGKLDMVLANLPYIPTETLDNLPVLKYEPRSALDGGPDGLRFINELLRDAKRWWAPEGAILLEIEAGQGERAHCLAHELLPDALVTILPDLAGLPRIIMVEDIK